MTNNELLLAISNMMDQKSKAALQPILDELRLLREDVRVLIKEVATLKDDVVTLKRNFRQMQLIQENQILPRLNTIEACYTDTYHRYRKDADIGHIGLTIQLRQNIWALHPRRETLEYTHPQ